MVKVPPPGEARGGEVKDHRSVPGPRRKVKGLGQSSGRVDYWDSRVWSSGWSARLELGSLELGSPLGPGDRAERASAAPSTTPPPEQWRFHRTLPTATCCLRSVPGRLGPVAVVQYFPFSVVLVLARGGWSCGQAGMAWML